MKHRKTQSPTESTGLYNTIFKQPDTYAKLKTLDFVSVQHIAGKAAAVLYMALLEKRQQRGYHRPHSSDFSAQPEKAAMLQREENEYGEKELFYFTQEDAKEFKIKNLYRTMRRLTALGFVHVVWRAPKYYTRQDGSTISARGSFLKTPRTIYRLSNAWEDICGHVLTLDGKEKRETVEDIISQFKG